MQNTVIEINQLMRASILYKQRRHLASLFPLLKKTCLVMYIQDAPAPMPLLQTNRNFSRAFLKYFLSTCYSWYVNRNTFDAIRKPFDFTGNTQNLKFSRKGVRIRDKEIRKPMVKNSDYRKKFPHNRKLLSAWLTYL